MEEFLKENLTVDSDNEGAFKEETEGLAKADEEEIIIAEKEDGKAVENGEQTLNETEDNGVIDARFDDDAAAPELDEEKETSEDDEEEELVEEPEEDDEEEEPEEDSEEDFEEEEGEEALLEAEEEKAQEGCAAEEDDKEEPTEISAISLAKAELSSVIEAISTGDPEAAADDTAAEKTEKIKFKLTAPENLQSILQSVCAKRGRKLTYSPKEVIFEGTYKVLGTDKKNEEGIKVKDIIDAEIKEGVRLGYLDRFDGLKTSEIKEEYENDVVYEFAEQEFKKTGLVLEEGKIKVYIFDWDLAACHHVGCLDEEESKELVPYLNKGEDYSFDIYGIITGGKAKRVTKDESGKVTVTKEKDGNIGIELDVSILKRKD